VSYGIAVASVSLAYLLKRLTDELVGPGPPLIFFVPAVTFCSWVGGLGPGLVATALTSAVCAVFLFPPVGSPRVSNPNDVARLTAFVLEGVMTSVLMGQLHSARRRSEADRRAAERYRDELAMSEERLRAIMDNSNAIIYLKDIKGKLIVINKRLESVLRVSKSEVLGKADHDVFAGGVAEALWANDRDVLRDGRVIECEEVVPQEDGEHTYVSLKFPLLDAGGVPYAVGGISTDITALKAAQRRALQAERLAAIGQMVAGLAHESRNALQRGQACLEMLALRLKDRPEALELVAGAQESQDDLHRLYEEVRGYAAPIVLDRRPCRVRDVLHQAWDRLGPNRRGRDAVLRERGDPAASYLGDRFRLAQVFRNILENSLAACRDPVEIDVDWSATEVKGRPAVRVAVRDNGPGLSSEQRQNLFEPFYTTKTQGTGLGLAIARRIVEAHDGLIQVDPDGGPGASILITLPKYQP
jgi:PAS domain S-box-containing protein